MAGIDVAAGRPKLRRGALAVAALPIAAEAEVSKAEIAEPEAAVSRALPGLLALAVIGTALLLALLAAGAIRAAAAANFQRFGLGLVDLFHFRFRIRRSAVDVRVIFLGQLAIGGFDFVLGGVGRNAQYAEGIPAHFCFPFSFLLWMYAYLVHTPE